MATMNQPPFQPALTDPNSQLNLAGMMPGEFRLWLGWLASALVSEWANTGEPPRHAIAVVPEERKARELYGDLTAEQSFAGDNHPLAQLRINYLPEKLVWGLDRYSDKSTVESLRSAAIGHRQLGHYPTLTIATLTALQQYTLAQATHVKATISLETGESYDRDELAAGLIDLGFIRVDDVTEWGQFAVKGSIVDIFSAYNPMPMRLEFFADTLTKMQAFDAQSQLTTTPHARYAALPVREIILPEAQKTAWVQGLYDQLIALDVDAKIRHQMTEDWQHRLRTAYDDIVIPLLRKARSEGQQTTFFDYAAAGDILLFPDGMATCAEAHEGHMARFERQYLQERDEGKLAVSPDEHFAPLPEPIEPWLQSLAPSIERGNPAPYEFQQTVPRPFAPAKLLAAALAADGESDLSVRFQKWLAFLEEHLLPADITMVIGCSSRQHIDRLTHLLSGKTTAERPLAIDATGAWLGDRLSTKPPKGSKPADIVLALGNLAAPMLLLEASVFLVPEARLLHISEAKTRRQTKKRDAFTIDVFKDLNAGDPVIHISHGVGKFIGCQTVTMAGYHSEFVLLEYLGGDKVYVPVDKLNMLQRYSAKAEGSERVRFDKLRSKAWSGKKSRAQKAVEELAGTLLQQQAKRQLAKTTPLGASDPTYYAIEGEFPYQETPDQQSAIDDIHQDLQRNYAMDRIICGDVGFGKTEVALRAATRVALEGQQVLILVPTTVLCFQHYRTFHARLSHHGLVVEYLNRTRSAKAKKEVIAALKGGAVDVLIGTHRILSKDIEARQLGLIIVDEEQRFGVKQKELLKKLSDNCHVLTMTATPIPRTLHMSTLGIRDISIIADPPADRLAVKTHICPFDWDVIQAALSKEIDRGGQALYLCNKVTALPAIALALRDLLPGKVKPKVAHGQMPAGQLEDAMLAFIEGEFNVLVATTIIESGIDIPNANTLIVQDSQNYGLTQLYQIRGRIGRSHRQSYAYFCLEDGVDRASEAAKRLEILRSNEKLGSGFAIAQYDLEIRGAGNLLGASQSGHIAQVGFELYKTMLDQAVAKLQGGDYTPPPPEPEIKLDVEALLPEDYIAANQVRLGFYKKLFASAEFDELDLLEKELIDRFGPPPPLAQRLLMVAKVKCALKKCRALALHYAASKNLVLLSFDSLSEAQLKTVVDMTRQKRGMTLTEDFALSIGAVAEDPDQRLERLITVLTPLADAFDLVKGP